MMSVCEWDIPFCNPECDKSSTLLEISQAPEVLIHINLPILNLSLHAHICLFTAHAV